jgi:hypothetical protein
VALREANHVPRRIDPDDTPFRRAGSDFRCNLSIAASDVEDPLRAVQINQSNYFLSHRFLER